MYAIIKTGGKQYRVEVGENIEVEYLEGSEGDVITFEEGLLIKDNNKMTLGNPKIDNAQVVGKIVTHKKQKKLTIFKMKRRHNYKLKKGHRQQSTKVEISAISPSKEAKRVA